ncbi:MAG: hypothetical protein P8H59_01900 [Flavobacteriales bacterium]|nr:hypothetical protein [Flavobacteriales bacterium]
MVSRLLFSVLSVLVLTGCVRQTVLTNSFRQEYKLTKSTLENVEYTLTNSIVLYRANDPDAKVSKDGVLVVSKNQEVIRIPEGSKGKAVFVGVDKIGVQFDDTCDCFLFFGSRNAQGAYELLAEEWENGHGKVTYNNKTYFASPRSGKAAIALSVYENKSRSQQRTVSGVE